MASNTSTEDQHSGGALGAVRRRPAATAAIAAGGLAVGAVVGLALPDEYTAETRLAVGADDVRALSIPGYALGVEQIAASAARYLGDTQARGQLEGLLGPDAVDVSSVSASPIPDSSILRVEAVAGTEDVALRAASVIRDELVDRSAEVNSAADPDATLQALGDVSRRLATAERERDRLAGVLDGSAVAPSTETEERYVDVQAEVDVLQAERNAVSRQYEDALVERDEAFRLVAVAEPAIARSSTVGDVQRYGFIGLVLGGLAAVVVAVARERAPRRSLDA
ncbi:hypothetical protein [Pseudokineococcus lusitanus]|uniref:Polysaccharide chain length determinant N-terminal domain-containing protein n=1 Tax=Pseudokineococcus lusitanus TaxID=763993 RepID=A0A3N1G917_9ACTN|nr:hypothetical protein [Pseudokineococcus lusitanus]ROP26749.1 hypothetical protein EDC03_3219 [Pseudokineococcus lusitanus]